MWVLLLALCVAVLLVLGCAPSSVAEEQAKNFILISLDTLRADHLGLYGYEQPTSPFLDSLAERAVVFDHAFAQYPNTLTSHMSMLTGLYPAEHSVYPPAGILPADVPTLAEYFRDAGYRTAGFTEGGFMRGLFGFRRGFEDFGARDRTGSEHASKTFRRGTRFLKGLGDEPFFLFIHTYATHAPYDPPLEYQQQFWQGKPPADTFSPSPENLVRANHEQIPQSPEALAYYRALYDAGIRYLDDVLRGFFEELDESGRADDTIVIITSDHGEEFREHGRFNHEQLYNEVLQVPLLIVAPASSGAKGRRSQRVAELVDIAPTLLSLADIEGGEQLSGTSLAKERTGTSDYPKRTAYAEVSGGRRSLYSLDAAPDDGSPGALFHLLSFPGGTSGQTDVELYRTSTDRQEQINLAPQTANTKSLLVRLKNYAHSARATAEQGDLSDELRERLKSMGYLQ